MTTPAVMNGTKLLIQLGDGEVSEQFPHPCMINAARGIAFSSSTNDQIVPDCDDPELPAWIDRDRDGLTASITGSGVLHTSGLNDFWEWFTQAESRNIRVKVDVASGVGGGYWAMAAHLTEFSVTGERKQNATFDCTIMSDGAATWVAA